VHRVACNPTFSEAFKPLGIIGMRSKDIWSSTWGSLIGVILRKLGIYFYILFNSGILRVRTRKKVNKRGVGGVLRGREDREYLDGLLDIGLIFSFLSHLQVCFGT